MNMYVSQDTITEQKKDKKKHTELWQEKYWKNI